MLKMASPEADKYRLIRRFQSRHRREASVANAGRNRLKRTSFFVLTFLVALFLAEQAPSFAQRPKRRPATPAPTPVPDMRPEALQVAEQIKNVSKFIYFYGKIVNSLQIADEDAKRGQASPAVQAANKKSKDALITNINGLRVGLNAVAAKFQANSRLQVQYLKISFAAEAIANAEQLATAGQYDEAGKALVTAVERLTDTLTTMRLL
jgi:hypothetical protein